VSASACSLIPAAARQFPTPALDAPMVSGDLLEALAAVVDPRARRGVRHRFSSILAIGVCAVLAGATSFVAIAEWASDLTPGVRLRLGLGRRPPSESTIRRVLQRVDAAALDRAVSAWLAARIDPQSGTSVIAIDGKSARGARVADERAVHLLAAFHTGTGVVLGQSVVDGKTNEISAFGPLLDGIDIAGAIVTADALHTQRGHADYLIGHGAHYLLTVKGNQPTLQAQLRGLPWRQVPVADHTTDKGHGRVETRTVKVTSVAAGIGFPHAQVAIQITRRRRPRGVRAWRTETVYAITDLTPEQASAAQVADAVRSHWGIENRLHWIRDVTFAEDLSQVRTGQAPAVMATLRNLSVSVHRLAGASNIAAACRRVARHPGRVLALLT
jgi:predicted transposase YbfD/YdcC